MEEIKFALAHMGEELARAVDDLRAEMRLEFDSQDQEMTLFQQAMTQLQQAMTRLQQSTLRQQHTLDQGLAQIPVLFDIQRENVGKVILAFVD